MHQATIERVLARIIKACLCLAVLAPLLLSADYFFPAIFPKAVYFRLLIEVALVAYVALAIMNHGYRPRYHAVYAALAMFAALVLLTSLSGENFGYSFWGNYERMDGIFSWLHYWAAIVIAPSVLRSRRDWLVLLSSSVGVAVLISGYGFMQRTGVAMVGPLTIYETDLGRITGTIANPAFLAVYLLFNITFALIVILDRSAGIWWRVAAGIAAVLIFTAYMMTGVRGAFLGFIASVIIFFLGTLLWSASARLKRRVGQGFFVFVVALALLYGLVGKSIFVTQNFGRLFRLDLADTTIQTRLVSWRGALVGFKDNFWLGVGPQKFDVVFNQHFDPRFYQLVGQETWWDRAHNMVLEVAVTMGIFGLLAYLGVGIALAYSLYRMGSAYPERRIEALIMLAFLAGYFIQNLFVFDTVSSYVVLTVFVGYIVARTGSTGDAGRPLKQWFAGGLNQVREFLPHIPERYWWVGGVVAAGIMAPIAYTGNIKLVTHNRLLLKNLAYAQAQPFSKTIENYKTIFELSSFDSREVGIKLSQYMGSRALSGELTVAELQRGYLFLMDALDQIIERNPKDVRLLLSYGNTLNVYGEVLRQQQDAQASQRILEKAERILIEASELGKARQQVFHSLANTYLIMGDQEKGIDTLVATAEINPDNGTTHWLLAFAYLQSGEYGPGIAAADRALEANYTFRSESEAAPVASALAGQGDWERLLRLYQKVAKDTGSGNAYAKVAATL
ncbi:MAG: O-antigen ligase family protein, partial [Parcubacteria group bacterium]|nr:O-antigen ligase family protein [Parcubacteria group bacterium]